MPGPLPNEKFINCVDYKRLYHRLVESVLKGKGESSLQQRQEAFNNSGLPEPMNTLIDKVALQSYKITDSDIAAQKQVGASEDQLFELIICGAVGQASRQYENGQKALTEALKEGGAYAS